MKIVCYAVVTGGRDAARRSPFPMTLFTDSPRDHRGSHNVDAVMLATEPMPSSNPRDFRSASVRAARWHSTHPHVLFPDADFSIYMNGSIRLAIPPEDVVQMMDDADIATFRHDRRDCLYEEGYEIAENGIDDPEVVSRQLDRYRAAGHPRHWGLWGLSFYARRHSPMMAAFNNGWWEEISSGSFRDQISFPALVRKHGMRVMDLPGTQDKNAITTLTRHPFAPKLWPGFDIRPAPVDVEIHTMIPYARDKNVGRAYNEAMERLPDGAWGCMLDHDAAFTTTTWWHQLQDAIARHPDGSFTAVTNRIHSPAQQAPECRLVSDDMAGHRKIGESRATRKTITDITDATIGWGGVLMLISKANWKAVGGFRDGMFCVDHQMHYDLRGMGKRVYVIDGLYLYHGRVSSSNPALTRDQTLQAKDRSGYPCACRGSTRADVARSPRR